MEFCKEDCLAVLDLDIHKENHECINEDAEYGCYTAEEGDSFMSDRYGLLVEFVVVFYFIEDDLLGFQETQDLLPLRFPIYGVHNLSLV